MLPSPQTDEHTAGPPGPGRHAPFPHALVRRRTLSASSRASPARRAAASRCSKLCAAAKRWPPGSASMRCCAADSAAEQRAVYGADSGRRAGAPCSPTPALTYLKRSCSDMAMVCACAGGVRVVSSLAPLARSAVRARCMQSSLRSGTGGPLVALYPPGLRSFPLTSTVSPRTTVGKAFFWPQCSSIVPMNPRDSATMRFLMLFNQAPSKPSGSSTAALLLQAIRQPTAEPGGPTPVQAGYSPWYLIIQNAQCSTVQGYGQPPERRATPGRRRGGRP